MKDVPTTLTETISGDAVNQKTVCQKLKIYFSQFYSSSLKILAY